MAEGREMAEERAGTGRGIVLTADDYGIAPGVSRAIRELLDRERLSATSCMVVSPDFIAEGPALRPYLDRADIGLHLTLTLDRGLGRVMLDAYLRRLDSKAMAAEVARQLARFETVMGRPPAYIDGHQHVHLLPGVREAVAEAAARIGAYVRLTDEPIARIRRVGVSTGKAAFLSILARPLAREAARRGLARNTGFRGVRGFTEPGPFGALFRRMIADASAGSIVMCHPGHVDAALRSRDPVTDSREVELAYFAGDKFPADLAAAGLRLARLSDC
jgi:chitin disaccharide deacetylase